MIVQNPFLHNLAIPRIPSGMTNHFHMWSPEDFMRKDFMLVI